MVMVVVVLLLPPPLSVLAPPWAPRAVAALLVATVPPLSRQRRWKRDFVLWVGLLQDGRRAQLGWLAEGFGGFVVARRGDLSDLAAAAEPRRRRDAHDGPEGGDGDFVLERAGVAFWPVVTLQPC